VKESIPALKRKIERLEAQLIAIQEDRNKVFRIYGDTLSELVDYKLRVEQSTRILHGEE